MSVSLENVLSKNEAYSVRLLVCIIYFNSTCILYQNKGNPFAGKNINLTCLKEKDNLMIMNMVSVIFKLKLYND